MMMILRACSDSLTDIDKQVISSISRIGTTPLCKVPQSGIATESTLDAYPLSHDSDRRSSPRREKNRSAREFCDVIE